MKQDVLCYTWWMPDSTAHHPRKHVIFYDDRCPMCTFQSKVLSWLDWFNCLSLRPISDPLTAELMPGVPREDMMAAMHCVSTRGSITKGARAIRFAALRLPLLVPIGVVLWVPGVIWIAEKVYQAVSRNRYVLSKLFGCKDACAIMPARKREQDDVRLNPESLQEKAVADGNS
jgi:predicted DCC family thiol-disulfide oxidoreductase YuxK